MTENNNIDHDLKYALFIVGQKRSLIDTRMQEKLKESFKFFKGDIFFVLEEDSVNIDLNHFNELEKTKIIPINNPSNSKNRVHLVPIKASTPMLIAIAIQAVRD